MAIYGKYVTEGLFVTQKRRNKEYEKIKEKINNNIVIPDFNIEDNNCLLPSQKTELLKMLHDKRKSTTNNNLSSEVSINYLKRKKYLDNNDYKNYFSNVKWIVSLDIQESFFKELMRNTFKKELEEYGNNEEDRKKYYLSCLGAADNELDWIDKNYNTDNIIFFQDEDIILYDINKNRFDIYDWKFRKIDSMNFAEYKNKLKEIYE